MEHKKNWLSHHLGFEKVLSDFFTQQYEEKKKGENKNDNKLYGEGDID